MCSEDIVLGEGWAAKAGGSESWVFSFDREAKQAVGYSGFKIFSKGIRD